MSHSELGWEAGERLWWHAGARPRSPIPLHLTLTVQAPSGQVRREVGAVLLLRSANMRRLDRESPGWEDAEDEAGGEDEPKIFSSSSSSL